MKKLLLLFALCLQTLMAWTQTDIPDSLKRDAYSVIRDYQLTVNAQSQKVLTTHCHMVITVLSKKGERHAVWHCGTSNFEKLTSFSGKVYNNEGKVVAKLKQSDIHTSQYSEHLATDTRHNYVEPPMTDYPYTVEYDWEVKATDGYIEYGMLSPIEHDRQALEHAEFQLIVPTGTQISYTCMPKHGAANVENMGKTDRYSWTLPSARCVIDDDYEDHALYILPSVIAIPREFMLGQSTGTLDSWESLGSWYAQLSQGRSVLPDTDIKKVKEITNGCANDREKIEALYRYLGEKTRYVSIQLGIGGWQPMTAEEVSKVGFGDCKALTNYMQALLREAGIASYQTIISTQYSDLMSGFPNMHQTDHVILTVPQQDGSNLVIECTNPQLPLGYVSGNYAGHEALQIKDGSGKLIRIPDYSADNSYEKINATVALQTDGASDIQFTCDHYGQHYGKVRQMMRMSEKELRNVVVKWMNLKDVAITGVKTTEAKDGTPHINVESSARATYGDVNGDKIFIPSNPFRSFSVPRFRAGRYRPIVVDNSLCFNDEISIAIPDGYRYTSGDIDESQSSPFGSYSFTVKQEGSVLKVATKVSVNKGRFSIDQKDEFLHFRECISKIMRKILVMEKK